MKLACYYGENKDLTFPLHYLVALCPYGDSHTCKYEHMYLYTSEVKLDSMGI